MKKVLFITTRNIFTTCGELRLIKNRAKALYDNWGIITDFIAACSSKKIKNRNEEMGFESKVTPVIFKIFNPLSSFFSLFRLNKKIREHIETGMYKCVVLSGVGTLSYVNYIRQRDKNVKIIADIHGSNEDILEFAKGKSLLRRIRQRIIYTIARLGEKKYLPKVDAVLAVSNGLVEYIKKEYHIKNPKCYIAPCAIGDDIMSYEAMQKYRNFYRNKYGIEKDTVLFVYSGGVSPWQCIDKSIELFYNIRKNCKVKCKMLILSHQIDRIIPLIEDSSDIITDKAEASEVKRIICSGDYAFLIRENIITNNVAYPNKFLEYVQSGMKIITTPFIYDVALQVKNYDLGIVFDIDKDDKQVLYDYITTKHCNNYESRVELLLNTAFGSTMKKFFEEYYQK